MQRPKVVAFCDLLLGFARLRERQVGSDGDIGVQLRIELGDPLQIHLRELHGRDFPGVEQLRCLRNGGEMKLVGHENLPLAFCSTAS